jgi:hypothetical protein
MAALGSEVVGWVGEAVAALLVGWVASKLNTSSKIQAAVDAAKEELRRDLADTKASFDREIARLEETIRDLENSDQNSREQSAGDHAVASALGQSVAELRRQSVETNAALNRVIGILEGRGIKR